MRFRLLAAALLCLASGTASAFSEPPLPRQRSLGIQILPDAITACDNGTCVRGIVIQTVTPGSRAAQAGLQRDDLILMVDMTEIRTGAELAAAVTKAAGATVTLVVQRKGERLVIEVQEAAAPARASWDWLDRYAGNRYLNLDDVLKIDIADDGTLVFGRYRLRRTADPRMLQVVAKPAACEKVQAELRPNGTLFIECEAWDDAYRNIYTPEGDDLGVVRYWKNLAGLNFLHDWEESERVTWKADTSSNRAAEAERTRDRDERNRIAAAERAEEEREQSRIMAQQIGELISGTNDYARKEAENNAQQEALLAGIAANARAAEARQQTEAQRQQAQQQAQARAQQEQRLAMLKQAQDDNSRRAQDSARQAAERQRQAEQDRRERAAADQQRQQQAAAAQEQRRRQAQAEEDQRRAAESAARTESERRAEDARRRAAEATSRQQKEQADRNHLAALRTQIRMGVKACGQDDIRVGGVLPDGSEDAGHIRVNFTVYCPGNIGVRGANNYFLGDGYSCVGSDMVQVKIPCEAKQARVVLDSVSRPK